MNNVYIAHASLDKLSVKQNKIVHLLGELDNCLVNEQVGALDRGKVVEVWVAELIGNVAPLGPIEMDAADHYRAVILPQAEAILNGLVETIGINFERTLKATFAVYKYRHDAAYPIIRGHKRPTLENYASNFEKVLGDVIIKYPNTLAGTYALEYALTN